MKLQATADFIYDAKPIKAGEQFDTLSDMDAHVLITIGKAVDAHSVNGRAMKADDGEQKPKRYNRRDLRAED